MYKIYCLLICVLFFSCSLDKIDDCIGSVGATTYQYITLPSFSKLNISEGIEVEIIQSSQHKIEIEVGENLKKNIEYNIIDDELYLKNNVNCSFGYTMPAIIKVYTPNLTNIYSNSQFNLYTNETLHFPRLQISQGLTKNSASCRIRLNIFSNDLFIETNNLTFFDISGQTNTLSVSFWGGNSRIEAFNMVAQHISIIQRSTNHMFLNPIQSIKGTIYGNGNVYLKQLPSSIDVTEINKGKIIIN